MNPLEKTKKLFSIDDIVIVKDNIKKTSNTFTSTSAMKALSGKKIKITNINWSDTHECSCVYADGWQWHPDDLYAVNHINTEKLVVDGPEGIFMFDPKHL